jgi:hypothetical protein
VGRRPLIVRTFDVLSSGKHVLVGQSYPPVASTDILHAGVNSMCRRRKAPRETSIFRQDTLGECLVQANAVVVPGMARKYALETAYVAGSGSSSASRAGTTLGYMGGVLPQRRGTLDLPG